MLQDHTSPTQSHIDQYHQNQDSAGTAPNYGEKQFWHRCTILNSKWASLEPSLLSSNPQTNAQWLDDARKPVYSADSDLTSATAVSSFMRLMMASPSASCSDGRFRPPAIPGATCRGRGNTMSHHDKESSPHLRKHHENACVRGHKFCWRQCNSKLPEPPVLLPLDIVVPERTCSEGPSHTTLGGLLYYRKQTHQVLMNTACHTEAHCVLYPKHGPTLQDEGLNNAKRRASPVCGSKRCSQTMTAPFPVSTDHYIYGTGSEQDKKKYLHLHLTKIYYIS